MPDPSEEPWGDLVIVQDHLATSPSGRYALIRAREWCEAPDEMTIWRGPEKPNETVPKTYLSEVSCKNLLVDEKGFFVCEPLEGDARLFYPCVNLIEALPDAVKKAAEKFLEVFANERAAESLSYVWDELNQDYGGEVWILASVGDSVAANGDLLSGQRGSRPPAGYVKTDLGGAMMGGDEQEIDKDSLVDPVADAVSEEFKTTIDPWTVRRIMDQIWSKDYILWRSDSGDTEIWVSRRAQRKHERELEERAQEDAAHRAGKTEELRRLRVEERRAKIRKGGYPGPKDWSPRGDIPGER